ncbi:MAG: hypothetical protein EA356_08610 [Geminicoccaceae bacterium]|nr:MAG: hypothetical protein EA356_08610 [Geminicoccaceae bacterium]
MKMTPILNVVARAPVAERGSALHDAQLEARHAHVTPAGGDPLAELLAVHARVRAAVERGRATTRSA